MTTLFDALKVGELTLPNRIVLAPLTLGAWIMAWRRGQQKSKSTRLSFSKFGLPSRATVICRSTSRPPSTSPLQSYWPTCCTNRSTCVMTSAEASELWSSPTRPLLPSKARKISYCRAEWPSWTLRIT